MQRAGEQGGAAGTRGARAHPRRCAAPIPPPRTHEIRRARTGQQRGAASGRSARALMQRPAALAVKREHQVMECHERRAVADRHARAAQALDQLAEALLHVHLPSRVRHLLKYGSGQGRVSAKLSTTARASHLASATWPREAPGETCNVRAGAPAMLPSLEVHLMGGAPSAHQRAVGLCTGVGDTAPLRSCLDACANAQLWSREG